MTTSDETKGGGAAGDARPPRPRQPNRLLTVMEPPRAMAEAGALVASSPLLVAGRRGDGRPVLVIPGLSGGNGWSAVLRRYLDVMGHAVHGPRFATTKGSMAQVRRRLTARVAELADQHGQPVSIVGWSVGGCFARQVAGNEPTLVRQVVTLGTPLDGAWYSPDQQHAGGPLPVPSTSIYSRTDGIFDWRRCVQPEGPTAENIAVCSSHLGMATNPIVFHAVHDRLSQPPSVWRRYTSPLPG